MRLDVAPIETQRLVLRAPDLRDWEAYRAFFVEDPRAESIGAGPGNEMNDRLAWRQFGHWVGHWVLRDFGPFAVTLKGQDTAIGLIGPWHPVGWPEPELAWTLWSSETEGKGIAHEAALAARQWAWDNTGIARFVSYIPRDNTRSAALARRLGCTLDPDAPRFPGYEGELGVYRHPTAAEGATP
ncbi:MAG: GNAT family N-acetyltransferase [Rhodobacterales bacterium]|nr:MAG: GNAT family N-acetyltransferase [Rhodobacterales bacterium]